MLAALGYFTAACSINPPVISSSGGNFNPKYPNYPVTNTVSVNIPANVINTINPLFFGIGFWDKIDLEGTAAAIKPLNIKLLRAGGAPLDQESLETLDSSYMDSLSYYCSSIGATPLLQIPILSSSNTAARVSRALNILSYYINTKGYPITWVEIGNESELYINLTNTDMTNWNVYLDTLTNVSAAIKSRYPSLKIVPDLFGDYYQASDYLISILQNCGKYVDAVSIHYYPFYAFNYLATYDAVTNQYDAIKNMFAIVTNTFTTYGQGQPIIIGECQVASGTDISNTVAEASLGTYEAGLWFADFADISASYTNIISVMPWDIGHYSSDDIFGFLRPNSPPKPIYYIYKLLSNHALANMVLCSKPTNDIRIYAYKDSPGNASVYCVNWNKTVPYTVSFNFTGGLLNNTNITYTLVPLSFTCISISADLSQRNAYTYSSVDADDGYGIEATNF